MAAYALSRSPNNRDIKCTQESTYTMENISEINNTEELCKGTFPIS